MDVRDFEGLTIYKLFIPVVLVINWLMMIVGPSLFPVGYQQYCLIGLIYLLGRLMAILANLVRMNIAAIWVNRKAEELDQDKNAGQLTVSDEEIYYAFIIPNYQEELQLLRETLEVLAKHRQAKENYLVFLAMEAHEAGSDLKAQQLINQFKNLFFLVGYTRHTMKENEQKGKAANVSWCAQHIQPILKKQMINIDSVFLTIIDADSWVPEIYMDLLDQHVKQNYEERLTFIYQPPQIFTKNNIDVPIVTRCCDLAHCFAHCGNLYSIFDFSFALSNYTLSYSLVKRIGFWDTCADAIGEDLHTTLKAYWKTRGKITCVPIPAPFNQANLETGKGYWENCKAKFWQVERHMRGVIDVAYNFKMLFNQPFKLKNLVVWFFHLDTFLVFATVPWMLIGMNYQQYIVFQYERPSPELLNQSSLNYLLFIISFAGTLSYILFELFKRRANKAIYKKENESIFRVLEYMILFPIFFLLMTIPGLILASFGSLHGDQGYVVANKRSTRKQPVQ